MQALIKQKVKSIFNSVYLISRVISGVLYEKPIILTKYYSAHYSFCVCYCICPCLRLLLSLWNRNIFTVMAERTSEREEQKRYKMRTGLEVIGLDLVTRRLLSAEGKSCHSPGEERQTKMRCTACQAKEMRRGREDRWNLCASLASEES